MVNFIRSNAAVIAVALLASLQTSHAAYGRFYFGDQRPSMALGSGRFPTIGGPSSLSRDARRVIYDMDEIFDNMMLDRRGLNEIFYEPFSFQYNMDKWRPSSYFLPGLPPTLNALVPSATTLVRDIFGITQDEERIKIVVEVPPGAKAGDINLNLDEDGHVLSISGETKREEGGISVHSRFERSFKLNHHDVDTSKITAQLDNGVLTIVAPKYEKETVKENVRRIDIVESNHDNVENTDGSKTNVGNVDNQDDSEQKMMKVDDVDSAVIDLDARKD